MTKKTVVKNKLNVVVAFTKKVVSEFENKTFGVFILFQIMNLSRSNRNYRICSEFKNAFVNRQISLARRTPNQNVFADTSGFI